MAILIVGLAGKAGLTVLFVFTHGYNLCLYRIYVIISEIKVIGYCCEYLVSGIFVLNKHLWYKIDAWFCFLVQNHNVSPSDFVVRVLGLPIYQTHLWDILQFLEFESDFVCCYHLFNRIFCWITWCIFFLGSSNRIRSNLLWLIMLSKSINDHLRHCQRQ